MKAGYKRSELGEIPVEWEVVRIKDIGKVVTGNTPSTFKSEYYTDDAIGYLWASPADLGEGKYILNTTKRLTSDGFDQSRKIPSKSILVTCIGSTIGKIGMAAETMSSNQQINSIICNNTSSSSDFFYHK